MLSLDRNVFQNAWFRRVWVAVVGSAVCAVVCVWGVLTFDPYPAERFDRTSWGSTVVMDRFGSPLRDVPRASRRARWVSLEEVSPFWVDATLASEDAAFFEHCGVDGWSVLRAVGLGVRHRRVYSGASTISMQLARILRPDPPECAWVSGEMPKRVCRKGVVIYDALRMEARFSKREILEQYMNRIPYGKGVFGVGKAAEMFLGTTAQALSVEDASFLAVLPRAPSYYNPHRAPERVERRRRHILNLMHRRGLLSRDGLEKALYRPPQVLPWAPPFQAPHAVSEALQRSQDRPSTLRTTLHGPLQKDAEAVVAAYLDRLERTEPKNGLQGAVVIMDHARGEILAWVGSRDWHHSSGGRMDAVSLARSPGSTLKPFLYAHALEHGRSAHAPLFDVAKTFSSPHAPSYTPRNFDRRYRGAVSMRLALAGSLNIPAVSVLDEVGIPAFYDTLQTLGFTLHAPASNLGLSLALGGTDVSLLELVGAYATLARGGVWVPPRLLQAPHTPATQHRVFSPEVAFLIRDMLSDSLARTAVFSSDPFLFPYPVAVKTGTSQGWRDHWVLGSSTKVTVGVWIGRVDGKPLQAVGAMRGAGPLFRDILHTAHRHLGDPDPMWDRPKRVRSGEICTESGHPATARCPQRSHVWVLPQDRFRAPCSVHGPPHAPSASSKTPQRAPSVVIETPRRGALYGIDPSLPRAVQSVTFRARWHPTASPDPKARWCVDGHCLPTRHIDRDGARWLEASWPLERGEHRVQIRSGADVFQSGERVLVVR